MILKYIELRLRDDGRLESVRVLGKRALLAALIPAAKATRRDSAFAVDPFDEGDVETLKIAVTAVGGPSRMAGILGASVPAIYNWLKREQIPRKHRAMLLAIKDTELRGGDLSEIVPEFFDDDEDDE